MRNKRQIPSAPFEQLKAWRLAHDLAIRVYKATERFPRSEQYGLTAQIRRAAVAVAANLVEGNARHHKREYLQFCYVSRSSAAELKYLLRLTLDLGILPAEEFETLYDACDHTGAVLHGLITALSHEERQRVTP